MKLRVRIESSRAAGPVVAWVTENTDLPPAARSQAALLLRKRGTDDRQGFALVMRLGPDPHGEKSLKLPPDLAYLSERDVISYRPASGEFSVLYRTKSFHNSLFLTHRCNNACGVCSQPPLPTDPPDQITIVKEAIKLIPTGAPALVLSGGEPTLLGDDLVDILRRITRYLPETEVDILSNARLLSYGQYARRLTEAGGDQFRWCVALFSDVDSEHDRLVGAPGAYGQTLRGIMNLGRLGARVEIRCILESGVVERLPQLARFIVRNLPFVEHVALMGVEMTGYARAHADAVWVDPADYSTSLSEAAGAFDVGGIDVSIYNHQLCVTPKPLWRFCRRSISDWKNEYVTECQACCQRQQCGGFFTTGLPFKSRAIAPIT